MTKWPIKSFRSDIGECCSYMYVRMLHINEYVYTFRGGNVFKNCFNALDEAILISKHNTYIHDKIRRFHLKFP